MYVFLYAENTLAAVFGNYLYAAYCTELYFYPSTCKKEINAAEMC